MHGFAEGDFEAGLLGGDGGGEGVAFFDAGGGFGGDVPSEVGGEGLACLATQVAGDGEAVVAFWEEAGAGGEGELGVVVVPCLVAGDEGGDAYGLHGGGGVHGLAELEDEGVFDGDIEQVGGGDDFDGEGGKGGGGGWGLGGWDGGG